MESILPKLSLRKKESLENNLMIASHMYKPSYGRL